MLGWFAFGLFAAFTGVTFGQCEPPEMLTLRLVFGGEVLELNFTPGDDLEVRSTGHHTPLGACFHLRCAWTRQIWEVFMGRTLRVNP